MWVCLCWALIFSHTSGKKHSRNSGKTGLGLWYSKSSWKITCKDLEWGMRTSGISNIHSPQSESWKRCRSHTNTQANHWAKTSQKVRMKGRILGGILKWNYKRRLVLTCENGGSGWASVLSFAYDSEVSFVLFLSGLISMWKGYFCKKRKNGEPSTERYNSLGDSGDCGAQVEHHPKCRTFGRLLWPRF